MSDASRKLKDEEINSAISLLEFLLHNGDQITQLNEGQRVALMKAAGCKVYPQTSKYFK